MRRTICLGRRLTLLALLFLAAGCAYGSVNPKAVKEYRYFPEYRGYLPISDNKVELGWVLPVLSPDGKPDYTLPSTSDEAEQRVKKAAERGKKLHPAVAIPVVVVALPFFYAFHIDNMVESAERGKTGVRIDKSERSERSRLDRFAGIKVKMLITDVKGNGISGAHILEIVSPVKIPIFADKEGHRSFIPAVQPYTFNPRMVELMTEHLPIHLGQNVTLRNYIGVNAVYKFGYSETLFNQRSDQSGKVEYTSPSVFRFADCKAGGGCQWVRDPIPLTIHFFIWAPGFNPAIYSISKVNPGDELNLTPSLERLPDGENLEKAYNDFEKIYTFVPKAINLFGTSWEIKESKLKKIIQTLEERIQDETLPNYIRWNSYQLLDSIYSQLQLNASRKKITNETKVTLERLEEISTSLRPYLKNSHSNPWDFKERYERLFCGKDNRRKPGEVHKTDSCNELMLTPQIVDETRDLLLKWEAVDPDIPELDSLRAIIALSNGDRERALILSRSLNHSDYFRLFYGLNLVDP